MMSLESRSLTFIISKTSGLRNGNVKKSSMEFSMNRGIQRAQLRLLSHALIAVKYQLFASDNLRLT